MEVPARREAHHLDLQGWPCLNLFNVCGIWLRTAQNEWLIWLILLNMLKKLEGIGGTELLKLQADSGFPPPLTSLGRGNMRVSSGHRQRMRRMLKAPTSCPLSSKLCILQMRDGASRLWAITLSARERSYYGNDNVITNLPSLCLSPQLPWSIMINLWSISEKNRKSVVTSRILQLIVIAICHVRLHSVRLEQSLSRSRQRCLKSKASASSSRASFGKWSSHWGSQPMDCQWSKKDH
jgi:hypothetical protein